MDIKERIFKQRQLILDAHKKYIKEWNKMGEAGPGLLWFCQHTMYIDELLDKNFDVSEFPVPKNGGEREARLYMKKFILDAILMHYSKLIDLHSDVPFEYIEKSE